MDPELEGVWSVTCFVVRKGFRQAGLTYELATATVEYGEQVGARVLEGYPIEPPPGKTVIWDEASVGLLQVFLEAGYEVTASPTLRRRVVRRQPRPREVLVLVLAGLALLERRGGARRALLDAAGEGVALAVEEEVGQHAGDGERDHHRPQRRHPALGEQRPDRAITVSRLATKSRMRSPV